MADGYLSVKNWAEKQHYKDRNPPWIKLHRDLLRDYEFSCLRDASKLLLMELWLLASQLDNKIPNDTKWLQRQLPYDGKIDLKPLIDSGFLLVMQDASALLADCKQVAMLETETETEAEAEAEHWSKGFDRWWEHYPNKTGKKPAKAIWKRIKPDADLLIADAMKRKTADSKWSPDEKGKTFIPNPTTYLNQERWHDELQQSVPVEGDIARTVRLGEQYLRDAKGDGKTVGRDVATI